MSKFTENQITEVKQELEREYEREIYRPHDTRSNHAVLAEVAAVLILEARAERDEAERKAKERRAAAEVFKEQRDELERHLESYKRLVGVLEDELAECTRLRVAFEKLDQSVDKDPSMTSYAGEWVCGQRDALDELKRAMKGESK